jgi:hypothetical protein
MDCMVSLRKLIVGEYAEDCDGKAETTGKE